MKIHPVIVTLLITVSVMAVVNALALQFSLFWYYWWLGFPVHVLGGVSVILLLYAVRVLGVRLPDILFRPAVLLTVALVVGLGWEVFEVWVGIAQFERIYALNTTTDLIADALGGYIGYVLGTRLIALDALTE